MRQAALMCYASALAVVSGCGGATSNGQSAGSGGAGGSITYGGSSNGGASLGGSSLGGSGCQELQAEAQKAADISCNANSDCIHPPHTAGDCTECGVVVNAANQESSLAAARVACLPFYEKGCIMATHSCPATTLHCNVGNCSDSIP